MRDNKPKLTPIKRKSPGFWGALGHFLYEIRPYVAIGLSIVVLRSEYASVTSIKVFFLGVIIFSAYVIYARLYYRGHIR